MTPSAFASKVQRRLRRILSRRLFCRTVTMRNARPIVSFTFDDFPRSALKTGGAILQQHGAAGTYYTSLGLMGRDSPVGEIFHQEDLIEALSGGHELGCHTFNHCHAWDTPSRVFEASVVENRRLLSRLAPSARFRSLSYPIHVPAPLTKLRSSRHFDCCRGGGQTINTGAVDANCLNAFFLEQSTDHPERIEAIIELNRSAGGWLIFATHDVTGSPTRYGCTPKLFESTVRRVADSGALILPVASAWRIVSGGGSPGTPAAAG